MGIDGPDANAVEATLLALGVFASPDIKQALGETLLFQLGDDDVEEELSGIARDLEGFTPAPEATTDSGAREEETPRRRHLRVARSAA